MRIDSWDIVDYNDENDSSDIEVLRQSPVRDNLDDNSLSLPHVQAGVAQRPQANTRLNKISERFIRGDRQRNTAMQLNESSAERVQK